MCTIKIERALQKIDRKQVYKTGVVRPRVTYICGPLITPVGTAQQWAISRNGSLSAV